MQAHADHTRHEASYPCRTSDNYGVQSQTRRDLIEASVWAHSFYRYGRKDSVGVLSRIFCRYLTNRRIHWALQASLPLRSWPLTLQLSDRLPVPRRRRKSYKMSIPGNGAFSQKLGMKLPRWIQQTDNATLDINPRTHIYTEPFLSYFFSCGVITSNSSHSPSFYLELR